MCHVEIIKPAFEQKNSIIKNAVNNVNESTTTVLTY